jgi:hypothetical protein
VFGGGRKDFPDPWIKTLASPELARAAAARRSSWRKADELRDLLDSCEENPPPPKVIDAMWAAFSEKARNGDPRDRAPAFAALFRLAPQVGSERRLAMRRKFLSFFRYGMTRQCHWPPSAMQAPGMVRSLWPGEGIPWEDDALSACLSWSSDAKWECSPFAGCEAAATAKGAFSYVSQAYVGAWSAGLAGFEPVCSFLPIRSRWVRNPLRLPLPPSPWQRARALHLRRPDLSWPKRAIYRVD